MKTSININLFGTLYAIDEDAHQLLQQYLASMKSYFGRQQGGDEIADDIEHRVAELFWELKQQGNQSITIEQVRNIIQEIGNPEELGSTAADGDGQAHTDGHTADPAGDGGTADAGNGATTDSQHLGAEAGTDYIGTKARTWLSQRRYYRDPQDKLVGGVLSGAAHYFGGSDPIVWRLLFVLLTIFVLGFPTIVIYLLLWVCAPEARTPEERLRMQGKAVNPENLKSQVLGYGEPGEGTRQPQQNSGCLGSATGFMALCFKILLILMAIPVLFVVAAVVFALFAALFGVVAGLFGAASGLTIGGVELTGALLAGEKWTLITGILSALAFIALGIYLLYRLLHRERTPFGGLSIVIVLGLMLLAALLGWRSFERTSDKIKAIGWGDIVRQLDGDDDEDFDEAGAVAQRDSAFLVTPFNKVEVEGLAQVIYRQGDSCSASVRGSEWLLGHTIVSCEDGKLLVTQDDQLGKRRNNLGHTTYRVYITAPYVTDLRMRGIGSVELEGEMTQEQPMNVVLEGIGKIDIDHLTCPKLHAVNNGAGLVEIEAYTDSLIVSNQGVGAVKIEGRAMNYQRNNDGIGSIDDKKLKIGM